MAVELDGASKEVSTGEMVTVERGVDHNFKSNNGAIFEEISTTHYTDDSFYQDKKYLKINSAKQK